MPALKTATYLLPEHLLPVFVYGTKENTEELEVGEINKLLGFQRDMGKRHGRFIMIDHDENSRDFVGQHALTEYGWKTDSCVLMTFAVDKAEHEIPEVDEASKQEPDDDCADYIEIARSKYALPSDDDIEIDDKPEVSLSENGCWVAAWVYVSNDELPGEGE